MEEKELKELAKELEVLVKKYGIASAAFTGNSSDRYIGLVIGAISVSEMFGTVMNVGRLWQHMRGIIRDKLAKFEKHE